VKKYTLKRVATNTPSQLIGKNLGISAGHIRTRKWLNMVMFFGAFFGSESTGTKYD
jgi:hypothetical protein